MSIFILIIGYYLLIHFPSLVRVQLIPNCTRSTHASAHVQTSHSNAVSEDGSQTACVHFEANLFATRSRLNWVWLQKWLN